MKQDAIGVIPSAIVSQAQDNGEHVFADRLIDLMAQAQSFGRKTIEQKVACGRKLVEAKEELAIRDQSAIPKKQQMTWDKLLKRFGFDKETARRLMTAARSHNSPLILSGGLGAIYDDGIDPSRIDGKNPCRPCRIQGKAYSEKCASCRSLNRTVPSPKEDDGPLKDEDGNVIPEHLVPVFREGQIIREFTQYLTTGTKALKGLIERRGCRQLNIAELSKRLASLKSYALKYRPGYVHLDCEGKGCDACNGDGWFTVMKVADERAALANEKKRQRAKEWHDRQQRANDPVPE